MGVLTQRNVFRMADAKLFTEVILAFEKDAGSPKELTLCTRITMVPTWQRTSTQSGSMTPWSSSWRCRNSQHSTYEAREVLLAPPGCQSLPRASWGA